MPGAITVLEKLRWLDIWLRTNTASSRASVLPVPPIWPYRSRNGRTIIWGGICPLAKADMFSCIATSKGGSRMGLIIPPGCIPNEKRRFVRVVNTRKPDKLVVKCTSGAWMRCWISAGISVWRKRLTLNATSAKIATVSIIENIDWKDCTTMEGTSSPSRICNFLFFEIHKKRFVDNTAVSIARKTPPALVLP